MYPAAFGCLIASKAYGVSRSAVIPRVLPAGATLVRANSRISIAALAATTIATPIGLGLKLIGAPWILGFAALLFFAGTWMAVRLPKFVDSNEGEVTAQLRKSDRGTDEKLAATMPDRRLRSVGPSIIMALRANAALRTCSGFMTLFFAFLVREHPIGGLKNLTAIGVIAAALAIGSGFGSVLGAWLKDRAPEAIVTGVLAAIAVVAVLAAFFYGLPAVLALALLTGLAPALAKLSLDALIQRDVVERVRASAFARTETWLQLAWVVGGAIGLVLPSNGVLGLSILAAMLCVVALLTVKALADLR